MKEPILYKITKPIINLFVKITFRPKYIGLENIPKSGKIVLAGNHTNILDPLLIISSTKRVIHFLAKDSLYKGFKGNIAISYLNKEASIGVFPEGTINKTDDIIMPFKIGAVKMAYETDSYIVPFTIKGKYKVFNNNLKIEFFKPYKICRDNLTLENEKLMKIISDSLERG